MFTRLALFSTSVSIALAWASENSRQFDLASTPPTKPPVAATWFGPRHSQGFSLSNVSWNKYTIVTYSFALTTPDVNVVDVVYPEVFKEFVATAHANNCSAAISVGGYTGGQYFSTAVATAENRTAFAKTLTKLVKDNNLDGLDFDWEYPTKAGNVCNTKSSRDTPNFLAFLQELRKSLPNTTFSAATTLTPFASAYGLPSFDISGFARVLDYIAIMNYDIWGPWSSSVGPNAPLNDLCTIHIHGSASTAVTWWKAAGMPLDQIVLGVPAYGYSYSVAPSDANKSYPPFRKSTKAIGDARKAIPKVGEADQCGGNSGGTGGVWTFWDLVAGRYLNENGTPNTAGGAVYRFDKCSRTPYVYNKTTELMVSYDDATSFAAKGKFIKSRGLRGFAMWEAGGDYKDLLLDSIRTAVGYPDMSVRTPNDVSTMGSRGWTPTEYEAEPILNALN